MKTTIEDLSHALANAKEQFCKLAVRILENEGWNMSLDNMARYGTLAYSQCDRNSMAFLWKGEHVISMSWELSMQAIRITYHREPLWPIKLK